MLQVQVLLCLPCGILVTGAVVTLLPLWHPCYMSRCYFVSLVTSLLQVQVLLYLSAGAIRVTGTDVTFSPLVTSLLHF